MELLKRLTETPGVPGREERVRDVIRAHTEGWWDELREDRIGNLIGTIKAAREKNGLEERGVIIACHLDQIGFYVRYIDDDGFLRIQHAGGFDTRNLFARRVRVMTARGDLVGILNPAIKPIHLATAKDRQKVPTIDEFTIDLGLPAREVKRRVRPGDPVVIEQTTVEMGKHVCGQAMDNRISPWVGLNAIEKVRGKNVYDIHWLGSVQEEVGLRGAMVAAQNIDAEIGIAVDVTLAVDTPGAKKQDAVTRLGDGVAIKVMDGHSISTKSLVDEFVSLAKKKKIKYQYEVLPMGGTDASALQRFGPGRRTITLSVPCRYVHTIVETVHRDDLRAAVNLLSAWLTGG